MKNIAVLLGFVLLGCSERVVYVYADSGAPLGDAQTALDDSEVPPQGSDASQASLDAGPRAPVGACDPDRAPGEVSHNDCRGLDETPVCDAITEECETLPVAACDACETDVQCREGVSLRADCVFMPGDIAMNNDSACLIACTVQADCAFLGSPYECRPFARGSYCAPSSPIAHCRHSSAGRGTHRISR